MHDVLLVTGGAGFIGSNFVIDWLSCESAKLVNLDRLTYAGNLQNLSSVLDDERHELVVGNINDSQLLSGIFQRHQPRALIHFAAESHVDRSIYGPEEFVETNVVGTFRLLSAALEYWRALPLSDRGRFRFVHVSTDEVYGSLAENDELFTEETAYAPNSPYAASMASSDHFVRAFHHTYGLPAIITNCSNNYGPRQFPEKLIPLMIVNALAAKPLPIYGDGENVRDWLHVADHCAALRRILADGRPGETYNIGGGNEKTNLEVVRVVLHCLQELVPRSPGHYEQLVKFVADRPGHDRRYAIDSSKLRSELRWCPEYNFEAGILATVRWYLENTEWLNNVTSGAYKDWVAKNYSVRFGQ